MGSVGQGEGHRAGLKKTAVAAIHVHEVEASARRNQHCSRNAWSGMA